jgi:menaquinone-dependent protoporphyrinogen oxidase
MEMQVSVIYASKHGATRGIAEAIAARLRERGHEAEAHDVEDDPPLLGVDVAVLGSAVYAGSWMHDAATYAERHAAELAAMPVWLFSSGPLGDDVEDDEQQPRQLSSLTDALAPRGHAMFAGALDRARLGFGERMIVKAVKAPDGDFRDWGAIRTWSDGIADDLSSAERGDGPEVTPLGDASP